MKLPAAILLFMAFVTIEGLEFTSDKFAILLTHNFPPGPIGKISVDHQAAGIVYSLIGAAQKVEIDSNTGNLKLLVNSSQVNNLKFEIRATFGNKVAKTEVKIIVLPLHHGDQFAFDAINEVRVSLDLHKKDPPPSFLVPAALDILLQQAAVGDPVNGISLAEEIVEKAINLVKSEIIHQYEEQFGDGAVLAFLKIEELFSRKVITGLDKEATCTVAETPVACLKKPIYRRFDGKCSNRKLPLAGAAGTPLVRISPAVYYDVDGLNDPFGFPNQPNPPPLPSPFEVTRDFIKDEVASGVDPKLTPLVMQFGQFMDHDFTLSAEEIEGGKCLTTSCDGSENDYDAPCYPILPLENNNPPCIRLVRSAAMCQREGYPKVREQLNDLTAVIDASNVYGSSKKTSDDLRDKTRQWIEIHGPEMKQIDTGMTTEVWAVGVNNDVFNLSPEKTWEPLNIKLTYVSAGGSGVWGIDEKNDVYHYLHYEEKIKVTGKKLKQIDSGPEGIVMGVTTDNLVYCRSQITSSNNVGQWWVPVRGRRLKHISCGRFGCWGVSPNDKVFYREGVTPRNCAGRSWISIDGEMSQIEVGGNDDVYAVNSDDELHIRQGVTPSNRYGTKWDLLSHASYVTTGWTGQYLIQDEVTYHASDDEGKLRTSEGDLLPLDTSCKASACIQTCFLAGDTRANDQQGLTAFHTLFLREHNRVAKHLRKLNPHWDGERIFQETRKIIGAKIQNIVYSEYLPILLGPTGVPVYKGHDENVNPGIINAFTLAYRLGHSMIRSTFDLLNPNYDPIAPPVQLRHLFFNSTTVNTYGVEPLLLGLVGNISEKVDTHLTVEITEHLFERGGNHGENLAALNIQRSRDHGLPGYNAFRLFSGLPRARTFEDTKNEIKDESNRNILKKLYNNNPDLVELWVAGIAETPVLGAAVGPTLRSVVMEQFKRARDGDRFFYENDGVFSEKQRDEIRKSNMARIFCDNVPGIVSIQRNAFRSSKDRPECANIQGVSLCAWKECLTGEPHFDSNAGKCVCKCRTPKDIKDCPNKWTNAVGYQPPFPIYSKQLGDAGSRFIDLNGDGRMDFVYHLWTPNQVFRGAYINDPVSKSFVRAQKYDPPYHIAAPNHRDLGARFVDLNDDGKADMVYHRYLRPGVIQKGAYLNTGQGWEKAPQYTPPFHISADRHGDLGARFVELNGDGKIDFVYHRWLNGRFQQKGAYINTGNRWTAAPNFTPPYHIAADGFKDLSARFIDLNGDGRMDLVYNRLLNNHAVQKGAYINNGLTWVWSPEFIPPTHITSDKIPDLGVRFVDLNADGRDDLVYYRWISAKKDGQKGAYLNNGYRWIWSPEYTPRFPISADNTRDSGTRFVDVNGDGLIDMVRRKLTGASEIRGGVAINTGCGWKRDDTFAPPRYIARRNDKDAGARFVELDGDGAVDMVWSLKLGNNLLRGAKSACAGNGNVGA